jgi:hypothetical protein
MRFPNYPSVLNRKKSFSIKEFMNKENGNGDFAGSGLSKVGETSTKLCRLTTVRKGPPVKAYSIAFNPLMLFDPTFILIGAGVVLVAVLEKQLAGNGYVFIAAALDSILKIAFPIVAVGSMIYLFSHSSFLL